VVTGAEVVSVEPDACALSDVETVERSVPDASFGTAESGVGRPSSGEVMS
jgi:hypothetical protein